MLSKTIVVASLILTCVTPIVINYHTTTRAVTSKFIVRSVENDMLTKIICYPTFRALFPLKRLMTDIETNIVMNYNHCNKKNVPVYDDLSKIIVDKIGRNEMSYEKIPIKEDYLAYPDIYYNCDHVDFDAIQGEMRFIVERDPKNIYIVPRSQRSPNIFKIILEQIEVLRANDDLKLLRNISCKTQELLDVMLLDPTLINYLNAVAELELSYSSEFSKNPKIISQYIKLIVDKHRDIYSLPCNIQRSICETLTVGKLKIKDETAMFLANKLLEHPRALDYVDEDVWEYIYKYIRVEEKDISDYDFSHIKE